MFQEGVLTLPQSSIEVIKFIQVCWQ